MKQLLFLLLSLVSLPLYSEETIQREEKNKTTKDYHSYSVLQNRTDFASKPSISSPVATRSVDFVGGYPLNAVIEEATGAWCGYCPRGIVMCDYIREHYSDRIFPIAIHDDDEMATDEYSEFFLRYVSSFPTAFVNRTEEMDISTESTDILYNQIKDQLTYAKVNVTAHLENNTLLIDSETEFAADVNSEHRLAFVVVEDGVGPYFQSNYYTGEEAGLGIWDTAGNRVLWQFNDVARHIKSYNGIQGSLPDNIKAGEKYSYSLKLELTNVSSPSCKVIAMIIDCKYDNIVNAGQYLVKASEGLYIDKGILNMAIGDQEKLTVYNNGSPLEENSSIWSSSDETVVTVDNNGNIVAVGPGNAVITVLCDAGSVQCQVYVSWVDSIFEIDGIRYKITGNNTCMVAFPKDGEQYLMEKVVIPSDIEVLGRSFEVTELEFSLQKFCGAFYRSPNLIEIELPNTITYLPGDVFEYCTKLKKFRVPSSVWFIDAYAFNGCRELSDLQLNEGLTGLWTWSCAWCDNLKNIELPSTLETMGREVFYATHPYWIHSKALVPPALQGDLFHDEYLTDDYEDCALVVPESSLNAYKNSEYWKRFEMIFPDDVILSRYKVKMNPKDELKLDVVNSDGASVTWFSNDPTVASVDTDGKITAKSFGETTVTAECKGKTVSCKIIVSYEGQTVKSEDLWYEIKENNTCAVIRNQSSELPYEMEKVNIPSEIVVSDQRIEVTEISYDAFNYCTSLTEITLPNSIKNIYAAAFWQCTGLTEIIFNEGLESLGIYALAGCENLESIVLPSTLKIVEPEVFAGDSPYRIVCKATIPPALENDLFDVSGISTAYSECVLIVPANSVSAYKEAEYWNRFENIEGDSSIIEETIEVEMESILLDVEALDLEVGDTYQFVATVIPAETTYPELEWWVDDEKIATIDRNGFLSVIGEGSTTVHVRSVRWSEVEATCTLDVSASVEGIIAEDAPCDIYTIDGKLIKKDVLATEIQNLDCGFYLIRQRGKTTKILK